MARRDLAELVLLAALWGASFLFMRLGAADFGPAALVFLRVAGAAALLLPLLLWRGQARALLEHGPALVVVGLLNTALPFALYMLAALVLNAGLSAIFNATTPLWTALIAWGWLGQVPSRWRALGLAIGFAGVAALGAQNASFKAGSAGISPALGMAACLLATLCYGVAANFTQKHLKTAPPLAVAAGSQTVAALLSAGPAWWWWPAQNPAPQAWAGAAVLALACTGWAYLLYFRLIARLGSAKAVTVTFLIPAFAVLWGGLFLNESLGLAMLAGCATVLLGTALATGLWVPGRARRPPA
jgi:drug/metabolite transporter (DMT)-like permease